MNSEQEILSRLEKLENAVPKATVSLVARVAESEKQQNAIAGTLEQTTIDVKDVKSYTHNLERRILDIESFSLALFFIDKTRLTLSECLVFGHSPF